MSRLHLTIIEETDQRDRGRSRGGDGSGGQRQETEAERQVYKETERLGRDACELEGV